MITVLALAGCSKEDWSAPQLSGNQQVEFSLYDTCCENDSPISKSSVRENSTYDKVEFYIMDKDGKPVNDIKSAYYPSTSMISADGLKEGDYTLVVLAVRGDETEDGVMINNLSSLSDTWLVFPSELRKPLRSEYFYSSTPFRIEGRTSSTGKYETVSVKQRVEQKRIIGKATFDFRYANPYISFLTESCVAEIRNAVFYRSFGASGVFSGETAPADITVDLENGVSYMFPPVAAEAIDGEISMQSRRYRDGSVRQIYTFSDVRISPNRNEHVRVDVKHPDDRSGLIFMTEDSYAEGRHGKILQDDEPASVYADRNQRSFNTAEPLQIRYAGDSLHLRFYSPKDLTGALVKAKIPALGEEWIEIAWLDRIPAFADAYLQFAAHADKLTYRTESGKYIEAPALSSSVMDGAEFKVESDDGYWGKLSQIRHGWTIYWSLYGGDPTAPDGKPNGNWMGIRPVHCRESVAMFLNFTYMLDLEAHEQILRENEDKLYGNGGPEDKVTAETVLAQMRSPRNLQVGLVYSGNNVLGLGGGTTFGAWQKGWFEHYTNTYACEVMFHELGHVMGYSHSSSFTYGPWAQQLMNRFYVDNIGDFPVESASYLDSKNNPNQYR